MNLGKRVMSMLSQSAGMTKQGCSEFSSENESTFDKLDTYHYHQYQTRFAEFRVLIFFIIDP